MRAPVAVATTATGAGRTSVGQADAPPNAVIYLRVSTREQALKGGGAEGYSLPAQRNACQHKAEALGAVVAEEFVDPGATGRTANRPGLQGLLAYIKQHPVKYAIIHKLDRLARDMNVHTLIWKQLDDAGVDLISCTEPIDNTAHGKYIRSIMAANATFYSDNLGDEVRKGLQQKVLMGGTPGYCRLGYLNKTTTVEGREVKGIVLDPERDPHFKWMFRKFATNDWSITDLTEELERRGVRNRSTATRPGKPLTRSQVHRILSSPYYIGKIPYKGAIYDGRHPPLIDTPTWLRCQEILAGRRLAGDRSWRHEHYLKGSLFCARCGSRLGFGASRGKTGRLYPYFFCLGRNKKRTGCDLPYLSVRKMEQKVLDYWRSLRVDPELIALTRQSVEQELTEQRADNKKLVTTQTRRLQRVAARREKLIDAYLDDAIAKADLKKRQAALDTEERDAQRQLAIVRVNTELLEERLSVALALLEHCERLYRDADDNSRRSLNQAFFAELQLDREGVKRVVLNAPFAQLIDRTIVLAGDGDDGEEGPEGSPNRPRGPRKAREGLRETITVSPSSPMASVSSETNPEALGPRGSNLTLLAEGEGFEPSTDLTARNGFETITK
jgi:site-specific DNA recombinase